MTAFLFAVLPWAVLHVPLLVFIVWDSIAIKRRQNRGN